MNPLTILLFLQETLPPPPTPTSSPDIDTSQVIGVVIISLALIVLGALAVRPLVARKLKPGEEADEITASAPVAIDDKSGAKAETVSRSIIQFPKQALTPATATDQPWVWAESEGSIEDRFRRVISDSGRRRKLGDRQPSVPTGVAPTRIRTLASESAVTGTPRVTAPLILSPIVPLNDRRGVPGETAQHAVAVAEPEIAVHSEVLAARSVSETEIGRVKPSNSHESTEPFVIVRKEEAAAQSTAQEETPPAEADDRPIPSSGPDWQAVINELDLANAETARTSGTDEVELPADGVLDDVESGGVAPSEADLELVEVADEVATFDIVDSTDVDDPVLAGIAQTVRNLIYYANAGKLINGFALYSDPYLFRFMDSTGLDEAGFRERFTSIPPRPGHEWERLDTISDIERLPDGRVAATVSYIDQRGRPTNGRERFRFDYSVESSFWMIDDIQTIDPE